MKLKVINIITSILFSSLVVAQNCDEVWKISQSTFEVPVLTSVNFNYTGVSNSGADLLVDFGDGTSASYSLASAPSFSHVYSSEGIYNITYTISGSCNQVKSSQVVVSNSACLGSEVITTDMAVCIDGVENYKIVTPSFAGWTLVGFVWNMGDGTFIYNTLTSINYIYNHSGVYYRSVAAHYFNSGTNAHCYYPVHNYNFGTSTNEYDFSTLVGDPNPEFYIVPANPTPGSTVNIYYSGTQFPSYAGLSWQYALSLNGSVAVSGVNPTNNQLLYSIPNVAGGVLCINLDLGLRKNGPDPFCSASTTKCFTITNAPCDSCNTFRPIVGERYWLSAWVKVDEPAQVKSYNPNNTPNSQNLNPASVTDPYVELAFYGGGLTVQLFPTGEIIDGWQRIVGEFTIPVGTYDLGVNLYAHDILDTFFDDIRIHPFNASMKSYVYDGETFWLVSELDDNNYATIYEYDQEGGLIRIKKETSRGIVTIQETRSNTVKN